VATGLAVLADPGSRGIVIGGSGNGEQIAANKVVGIRAALAWSVETARLGRLHNDAQVAAIGARMHTSEEAEDIVAAFLATDFSGDERHARRIAILDEYESTRVPPPLPAS
jgi:ribose 5-phosphate isomerase B